MRLKTKTLYSELCEMMPGGVSSPIRALYGAKRTPLVIESAQGDQITDIDQNHYLDFCASWGALILGHAEPSIMQKLSEQLLKGTSYGITGVYEHKLSKKIKQHIPSIDMLRFCSSGTESTMFALRLARGVTGKDYIVKFIGHYHGGADFLLTQAGSGFATYNAASKGIPKASIDYTLNLPFNDIESLEKLYQDPQYKDKIAAVIIEPIAANMGVTPADPVFIKRLRELTQQHESALIFDEVVTGFRVGLGGAQEYYGVEADLTCLGKVIGGGFPVAAYGGKKEYMQMLSPLGPVYQGGTLSGNPMALASGYHALEQLEQPGFFEQLSEKTQQFIKPIQKALKEHPRIDGCVQCVGSMFTLFFGRHQVCNMADSDSTDQEMFWKFFNYLFDRGIYWPPSPHESAFMMRAHSDEHLKRAQDVIISFIHEQ